MEAYMEACDCGTMVAWDADACHECGADFNDPDGEPVTAAMLAAPTDRETTADAARVFVGMLACVALIAFALAMAGT